MDLLNLIASRRSVRGFLEEPVEPEQIRRILEAANRAPSAGNLQAYEMYVVLDAGPRARLASAIASMEFFASAPVSLVFCTNPARAKDRYGERGQDLYSLQDATIACTFAMLAAAELGLGSVWVGAFNESAVRDAVGIPAGQRPVAILPIGVPAEMPEERPRRPLDTIAHWVR